MLIDALLVLVLLTSGGGSLLALEYLTRGASLRRDRS